MSLTRSEKERINDSRLKIQSAANSLSAINSAKVPEIDEIQECLESANRNLGAAPRQSESVEGSL